METLVTKLLSVLPAWAALLLMLGGFIFYVLGGIRLGYGAAVKTLVLDLIDQAEREIQGTKRGAERKAWVAQMLRTALSASKWGKFISWAITDETIGIVIQFFFDRMKAALEKE
nr:MAG TPA: hypothetical protein [Caudoviricetes sp.]